MHDITMYTPDQSLEPPEDADWHVFNANDMTAQADLTDLVSEGLPKALAALGSASARAVLDRRLSVTGPLQNLSPGAAEELLAMADAAGDRDLPGRISEALQRDRVADPIDEYRQGWVPPTGRIDPPMRPGRRTRRQLDRLLSDLESDRVYARRRAAVRLGGWDSDPEVVGALRVALRHSDPSTRSFAAQSLGQVADSDAGTWHTVLELAGDPESGPREVGVAIVLLNALNPATRRGAAASALELIAERNPAWTRDLRAFRERFSATW
jgi:hypothetical protein